MMNTKPKFDLGRLVATPGALHALEKDHTTPESLIDRHVAGEWGKLCAEDEILNEMALQHGGRLMSVYGLTDGAKILIITESDRSATTLLLPEDY